MFNNNFLWGSNWESESFIDVNNMKFSYTVANNRFRPPITLTTLQTCCVPLTHSFLSWNQVGMKTNWHQYIYFIWTSIRNSSACCDLWANVHFYYSSTSSNSAVSGRSWLANSTQAPLWMLLSHNSVITINVITIIILISFAHFSSDIILICSKPKFHKWQEICLPLF